MAGISFLTQNYPVIDMGRGHAIEVCNYGRLGFIS